MSTEKLIVELASRAGPVRPLASPAVRFARWASLGVVCGLVAAALFGLRTDLTTRLGDPTYVATALASSLTAMLGALAALVLAIPGAGGRAVRMAAWSALGLWAVLIGVALARAGTGLANDSHWPVCFARVLIVGALPGLALLIMLRR